MKIPSRTRFPLAVSIGLTTALALLGTMTVVYAQATALDYHRLLRFVLVYGCIPQLIIFAILALKCTRMLAVAVAVLIIATWIPVAELALRVFLA